MPDTVTFTIQISEFFQITVPRGYKLYKCHMNTYVLSWRISKTTIKVWFHWYGIFVTTTKYRPAHWTSFYMDGRDFCPQTEVWSWQISCISGFFLWIQVNFTALCFYSEVILFTCHYMLLQYRGNDIHISFHHISHLAFPSGLLSWLWCSDFSALIRNMSHFSQNSSRLSPCSKSLVLR